MLEYREQPDGTPSGPITFGQRVKEIRECLDISQAELARRLGVSEESVSLWERGRATPRRRRRLDETLNEFLRTAQGADASEPSAEPQPAEQAGHAEEPVVHVPPPPVHAEEPDVRDMSSAHLWILHDEVLTELKRRYRIATEQSSAERRRGVPMPLPDEARRSADRGAQNL